MHGVPRQCSILCLLHTAVSMMIKVDVISQVDDKLGHLVQQAARMEPFV